MGDKTRINAQTELLDRVTQEYYGKVLIWCSYDKWTVENDARYAAPYLDAVFWIIREFWQGADLGEAPATGEVVRAVRAHFRDLSEPEARMLDKVTRHPDSRALQYQGPAA